MSLMDAPAYDARHEERNRNLLITAGVAILALLIGVAAEKIEKQIAGSVALERAGTIERAVEVASHAARPGDVVLLAPACASFDQFQNYEHRGRVFKDLVHQLERQAASTSSGGR